MSTNALDATAQRSLGAASVAVTPRTHAGVWRSRLVAISLLVGLRSIVFADITDSLDQGELKPSLQRIWCAWITLTHAIEHLQNCG